MKSTGVRRAVVGASVCALTIVGFGAGTASAGEITGNGKPVGSGTEVSMELPDGTVVYGILIKGKSICAYSGLNDGFIDPEKYAGSPADAAVRVQNWGTDKKILTFLPKGTPGTACNPNSEPPPPPA